MLVDHDTDTPASHKWWLAMASPNRHRRFLAYRVGWIRRCRQRTDFDFVNGSPDFVNGSLDFVNGSLDFVNGSQRKTACAGKVLRVGSSEGAVWKLRFKKTHKFIPGCAHTRVRKISKAHANLNLGSHICSDSKWW